jgi:hypothetical protein
MVDIGDIIRDYQVIEHIGRGGMADVWSARDAKLSRMVAVKTIAHGLSTENDPVALFKREAKTIANLEHPHILPIYDFGEHQNSLYIVMRYVSGGSLAGWMERGQLTVDEALRVCKAMAEALDYAHARGVVHLDLKPQNILLDGHNSPYLADFGLATALDPAGRAINPGSGTLMYMAPEQLTSDTLDKRADLYSLSVMMYHLFNGRLPFDGTSPLVMKQLQYQAELPIIPSLPEAVTHALRRSVKVNPDERHDSALALVEDVAVALGRSGASQPSLTSADDPAVAGVAPEWQEAATLYQRARAAWDFGNGRFLLGVTHFMLVEAAYTNAEQNGLELDLGGQQMILRGALEYGLSIDPWWALLDDDQRRWVCLHAIRSPSAPARVRALHRLETLPDETPPRIPRQIAVMLQSETDPQAKHVALRVLGTRAQLRKHVGGYALQTAYIGRMLNTLAHIELKETEPQQWVSVVYEPEIDLLIAEMALDPTNPDIAEVAARTIGDIRSITAARYLNDQQRKGRRGALKALATVRDQAGSLPKPVDFRGQAYAWLANTAIRLRAEPLHLTWRVLLALLGAWVARGVVMWMNFPLPVGILAPDRISNALGIGLLFGLMVGLLVLLSDEIAARMRGFWGWPLRALVSLALGWGWGTLTFGLEHYVWLRRTADLQWELAAFGGFCLAIGFVIHSVVNLRAWLAVVLSTGTLFFALYTSYHNYCTAYGLCPDAPAFTVAPTVGVGLALGLVFGALLTAQYPRKAAKPSATRNPLPPAAWGLIGLVAGVGWAALLPSVIGLGQTNPPLTWLGMVGLMLYGGVAGVLGVYLTRGIGRWAFAVAAALGCVGVLAVLNPALLDAPKPVSSDPNGIIDTLFYVAYLPDGSGFDNGQVFSVLLPFALLIALGANAQLIAREVREAWRARRAAPVEPNAPASEFLNRPPSYMPDTATVLGEAEKVREELAALGVLPEGTRPDRAEALDILTARLAPAVDLDAPTGKVPTLSDDPNNNTEVRRLQAEDK